jgi:predicted RNase H-like nuclease (RuvC/YqgF family)
VDRESTGARTSAAVEAELDRTIADIMAESKTVTLDLSDSAKQFLSELYKPEPVYIHTHTSEDPSLSIDLRNQVEALKRENVELDRQARILRIELAELRTELRQARPQRAQSPRYEPEVEHGV